MFRTPVRFKHKARERNIAVALASERNAVIGAHGRSIYNIIHRLSARLLTPVDCVAPLGRATAITCALRLVTNVGSLAEYGKIT